MLGSFAMFTAIRNAWSRVGGFALDRRPAHSQIGICHRLLVAIPLDEAGGAFLDRPRGEKRWGMGHVSDGSAECPADYGCFIFSISKAFASSRASKGAFGMRRRARRAISRNKAS